MTSGRPRIAGLASWWVDVYTRTAPVDEAADRRGEVESDLHEQAAAAAARGTPARRVSWEIAGRMVRGMPADLAWRVEVEQAPGRLRWHLQHPATVYATALLVLIPLGLVADGTRTRGDVHRWSAAGALGLAALVGCAVVVAFGLVSLAYLRPSLGALRRAGRAPGATFPGVRDELPLGSGWGLAFRPQRAVHGVRIGVGLLRCRPARLSAGNRGAGGCLAIEG